MVPRPDRRVHPVLDHVLVLAAYARPQGHCGAGPRDRLCDQADDGAAPLLSSMETGVSVCAPGRRVRCALAPRALRMAGFRCLEPPNGNLEVLVQSVRRSSPQRFTEG